MFETIDLGLRLMVITLDEVVILASELQREYDRGSVQTVLQDRTKAAMACTLLFLEGVYQK